MYLHQACVFDSLVVNGSAVAPGLHPYSELAASFPANFATGGSGSIYVGLVAPALSFAGQQPGGVPLLGGSAPRDQLCGQARLGPWRPLHGPGRHGPNHAGRWGPAEWRPILLLDCRPVLQRRDGGRLRALRGDARSSAGRSGDGGGAQRRHVGDSQLERLGHGLELHRQTQRNRRRTLHTGHQCRGNRLPRQRPRQRGRLLLCRERRQRSGSEPRFNPGFRAAQCGPRRACGSGVGPGRGALMECPAGRLQLQYPAGH